MRANLSLVLLVACLVVVEIAILAVTGGGSRNSTTPTRSGQR